MQESADMDDSEGADCWVTNIACKVLLCVSLRNYNLCLKDYTVLCLISELIYDFEVEDIGLLVSWAV